MATVASQALRLDLLLRWAESQRETDRLFEIVKPVALYDRPIPERHRTVFYIGHLEAFDWNLLRELLSLDRFHSDFDRLFAFGIDPVDGGLPQDVPADWPSLEEVFSYRNKIRQQLEAALSNAAESDELAYRMNIAIEHRYMHAETLEYMFHQLPLNSKVGPSASKSSAAMLANPSEICIPAGRIRLGLDRQSGQFGWDNEFEAHDVELSAFGIDKHKVTNADFLEFVNAGGYENRSFWSDADWKWIEGAGIAHPVFWISRGSGFDYLSMFQQKPLPPHLPVFVSHAEASAYARWKGKRLPTEAEWQMAAQGAAAPVAIRASWDPSNVGSNPGLRSDFGVEDLYATGWEWTSTPFLPFPGFKIAPAYPGYSANFFDNKHFVMKGGSHRTAECMLRPTFRNWFQTHYQYVYAGFRCARD